MAKEGLPGYPIGTVIVIILSFLLNASMGYGADPILDWAKKFESMIDKSPRQADPDKDIISSYGTVVHESCLSGVSKEKKKEMKTQFDEIVKAVLAGIQDCDKDIRGIDFLPHTTAIVRRMKIICTDSKKDESFLKGIAAAYTFWSDLTEQFLPENLNELAGDRHQLFMVIPDSLQRFLKKDRTDEALELFHESLHQTWANSRGDHAEIEQAPIDLENPCNANKYDDRIIFFQTACGFHRSGDPAGSQLHYRLRHCPDACIDTLRYISGVPSPLTGPDADPLFVKKYGPKWSVGGDTAEAALNVCKGVRRRLKQETRVRHIEDIDAADRAEKLWRYLHQHGGGLRPDIPGYYLEALTQEERDELHSAKNLKEEIARNCPSFVHSAVDNTENVQTLLHISLTIAGPNCPFLNESHPQYPILNKLAYFHNKEMDLQDQSSDLQWDLKRYVKHGTGSHWPLPREIAIKAINLYAAYCPKEASAFRPKLCDEGGETEIIQAANDIADWLEP